MPAKVVHPAGTGTPAKGMPPAKLAGTVLLSGGGLVVLIVLIRALVNARRRHELAGF
jgi:TRAP-type C4-dicarboxylate transport system permease small subunit